MHVLFSAMLAMLLAACATVSSHQESDRIEDVSALTSAWSAAYNSRDPARIVAMYAGDAVFWGTTAKAIASNQTAIADYFKDAAKRPNARVDLAEQHIRHYGDLVIASGYYTFSDIRDGNRVARPARFTMVFRRSGGGWSIVAHHSSEIP